MRGLIFSTVLLLASAIAPGMAQTPPAAAPAAEQVAKFLESLNLSAAQKQQLAPILAEQAQKAKAIRDNTALAPRDRFAQMKKLRDDGDVKIRPILTAEQNRKLDEVRAQQRGKFMEQMRQRRNGQ